MKLRNILEYHNMEDYSSEQDKLVPMPKEHAYHGVHAGDFLKHAGYKVDKEKTAAVSKETDTIHAGTKCYAKGDHCFYVTGSDQVVHSEHGRAVHPLHDEHFMHIADHMGMLKKEQHPHKAITWADFDKDAIKKAGIKTFDD